METKYDNYLSYIFSENLSIEEILLPYGQKMDKYFFIFRIGQIFSLFDCKIIHKYPSTLGCIIYVFDNIVNKSQLYENNNDMFKLRNIVERQIKDQLKSYNKKKSFSYCQISDIFINLSILLENLYLYEKEHINNNKYSFNINHILSFIEDKSDVMGILKTGFNSNTKTYCLSIGVNSIINSKKMYTHHIFSDNRIYTEDETFYITYFEMLFLIVNTYNEHIKRLYCNEW